MRSPPSAMVSPRSTWLTSSAMAKSPMKNGTSGMPSHR